jgi:hypothetical protein
MLAREKNIVVIGLSDEDTAHLRLLMRKSAASLAYHWRWGTEENADLVVVDPSSFPGQMGWNRAMAGGRRCAVFSINEKVDNADLVLHKPLKQANLVEVLNQIGTVSGSAPKIVQQEDSFYDLGQLNSDFQMDDSGSMDLDFHDLPRTPPARGLEDMIKADQAQQQSAAKVGLHLDQNTQLEVTPERTTRSEARRLETPGAYVHDPAASGTYSAPPVKRSSFVNEDATRSTLGDFLHGTLLRAPVRLTLADGPSLTLDPKNKVFHSEGSLRALQVYVTRATARGEWQNLTTAELNEIRKTQPAQPYLKLEWLIALTQSGGRLASHLDPGGTYKLKLWPEVETDFPDHLRVAKAMMHPAKLNEIAAESGADMATVFDLVNAYAAIDFLEIKKRLPRHRDADEAPIRPGLMDRLKRPFGKN